MTPTIQKNIDEIALHIYFETGASPESFVTDHVFTAIDAVGINHFDKAQFLEPHCPQQIDQRMFNRIADAMWCIDNEQQA